MKYHYLFIFEKGAKFEIVVCCKLQVALYGLKIDCSTCRDGEQKVCHFCRCHFKIVYFQIFIKKITITKLMGAISHSLRDLKQLENNKFTINIKRIKLLFSKRMLK